MVLRGEAGVGKSTLLLTFGECAASQPAPAGLLTGYGQAMLNFLARPVFPMGSGGHRNTPRSTPKGQHAVVISKG